MEVVRTFSPAVAELIVDGWKVDRENVDFVSVLNSENLDRKSLVRDEAGTWQLDEGEAIAKG